MTALEKTAYFLNRRDEVPNQELARQLAAAKDTTGIAEIATNLWNKNKNISSDCLKVLYEIGYIEPGLIVPYVDDFLELIAVKDNRKVWGAMIALGTIADLCPDAISERIDTVIAAFEKGSVITRLWGVRVLAKTLSKNTAVAEKVIPILTNTLNSCVPRDMPTHLESMRSILHLFEPSELQKIIETREVEMTPAQSKRLKKAMRS